MNKTIRGVYCKPGLPLKDILEKWILLNREIAKSWFPKDVPWWYNERAALSIFAGVVWKAGKRNYVLEEYSEEKRKLSNRGKIARRKYKGRVDFYFKTEACDFIAEAKICWPGISKGNMPDVGNQVSRGIEKACEDIKKSKPYGQRRLAFLFVCPKTKDKKLLDERISSFVEKIKSNVECDAMAWIFPGFARTVRDRDNKKYYPGIVLLIKAVK